MHRPHEKSGLARIPLMIPGAGAAGRTLDVRSPYDDSLIATVETVDAQAVEQAFAIAAALYQQKNTWLSIEARSAILTGAARIMADQADELAQLIAREGGKPLVDARVEVARAVDSVHLCVEAMRVQAGRMIPMELNAASRGRLAFTQYEPIGVALAFSAFNHPLNLIVHQVGPAIAAGCPVIIKPAEATPLSCLRFVKILRDAGLPAGWCQPVVADDLELAGRMVSDERLGFFSFIGSARVGWMLRSRLAPGVRCALEHGGAAPVIVAEDADPDVVIPALAKGAFYHAGQVCVSVQRVFAHESIARKLAERLAATAERLTVGDPLDAGTDVGPLIRRREVARVHAWVEEAGRAGGEVLCGGEPVGGGCHDGSCYAPTVLFDPPDDAKVSRQEVFGPVACVYSCAGVKEAVERANALPFAFQAAVFTASLDAALAASRALDAAAVMINDHTAFRVDWMPFAGHKVSGLGAGGIGYAMREMQSEKLIVIHSGDEL